MKKIVSRYYLIIAILLVIADQFFIRLLLHSDLATGLSDFAYYLSDMMLHFLVVLLAFIVMIWSGKWQKINSRKFRGLNCTPKVRFFLSNFWGAVHFSVFFISTVCY